MLSPDQAPAPVHGEDVHTSAVLGAIIDEAPLQGFTLEWLIGSLPHRSFGAIMLLVAIVAMVPVVSIAAGLLLAILALQIVMGITQSHCSRDLKQLSVRAGRYSCAPLRD